jgi:arylformamidase
MTIYDITVTISNDMPVWPGDQAPHLEKMLHLERGDLVTLSRLESTVHLGTHLDAPMHFVRGGHGVDTIDLSKLIGACLVVYLPDAKSIDAAVLEQANIPTYVTRLLLRTSNSEYWARGDTEFHTDFVAIDPSGAEWMVERGLQLVGIDYLSVGAYEGGIPTHEILLGNGVVPVEGLNLAGIEAGEYQLICLPLKLKDCDGAPVRAVLMRDE